MEKTQHNSALECVTNQKKTAPAMTKSISIFTAVVLLLASSQHAFSGTGIDIRKQPFKLSKGATAYVKQIKVHRVTSDNTIDIEIILMRDGPNQNSGKEIILELAEFCQRYARKIIEEGVPENELGKLNLIAPIYAITPSKQFGFAFKVAKGECSLEPPFPSELVRDAKEWAAKVIE